MDFRFKTWKDAMEALNDINSVIDKYGFITLLDVKDIANWRSGNYKDAAIGWCDKNDFYLIGRRISTKYEPKPIEELERPNNKPEDLILSYCKADVENTLVLYKAMKDNEEIKQHEQHAIRDIEHAIDELIRAGYSYGDSIIESLRDVLDSLK